jgi:succinyl-CoA synthetase beta subunit
MRLLEHQSRALLAGFGLPFNRCRVVASVAEAAEAAAAFGGPVVLKPQVPAGGRGKAGAIKMVEGPTAAAGAAAELFALTLGGFPVGRVSVEPKLAIRREIYVGCAWDLRARCPVALVNAAGGVDVEAAAGRVVRRHFDPRRPLATFEGRELAAAAGLAGRDLVQVGAAIAALSRGFLALDATMLEINPLVQTEAGDWLGVDAHAELDDDAAPRLRPQLEPLGEIPRVEGGRLPTPLEAEAARIDAADHRGVAGRVVEFDGPLALLIGGGGASLTVFDAVLRHGGRPANYCEIGGNPTEEKVAALTSLLLTKPGVRRLAVIMNVVNNTRADVMARGVIHGIEAAGRAPAEVLSVFRIPGSWEEEAAAHLASHGVKALGREVSLDAAAALAVQSLAEAAAC